MGDWGVTDARPKKIKSKRVKSSWLLLVSGGSCSSSPLVHSFCKITGHKTEQPSSFPLALISSSEGTPGSCPAALEAGIVFTFLSPATAG